MTYSPVLHSWLSLIKLQLEYVEHYPLQGECAQQKSAASSDQIQNIKHSKRLFNMRETEQF